MRILFAITGAGGLAMIGWALVSAQQSGAQNIVDIPPGSACLAAVGTALLTLSLAAFGKIEKE